ncbi:MAG: phosphoribosylanthranilate isomerase [Candidatus Altiarchaeota archaeon]|nr:phosphoribosylanthranilate isomerase [Candidatus Altiarchaeota archaeon]
MNVKVCGITNKDDAMMVLEKGADAIGVVVDVPVETPRKITVEKAHEIRLAVEDLSHTFVTVLMPKTLDDVGRVVSKLHPDGIQLHGVETPDFVMHVREEFGLPIIKAIHVGDTVDMEYVKSVSNYSDMLLLDTKKGSRVGGTGEAHDVEKDLEIKSSTGKRILLSGGINPINVFERASKVKPYGVDVSSGVEKSPGIKDPDKVEKIIEVCSCL